MFANHAYDYNGLPQFLNKLNKEIRVISMPKKIQHIVRIGVCVQETDREAVLEAEELMWAHRNELPFTPHEPTTFMTDDYCSLKFKQGFMFDYMVLGDEEGLAACVAEVNNIAAKINEEQDRDIFILGTATSFEPRSPTRYTGGE